MEIHQNFISALHEKRLVFLRYRSHEKGIIERVCIPMDFGPSKNSKDRRDKYHFYDLDSPNGPHPLPAFPEDILELKKLNDSFDPVDFVTWQPNWILKRDWGKFS